MKNLSVYLVFNGSCREAFNFYQSVCGGDLTFTHYGDFPASGSDAEADKTRVMNASLIINENTSILGCDTPAKSGGPTFGNNFHVMLNTSTKEEADQLFVKLSENGTVQMPMAQQFWGAYFGMCIDQFDVQWKIAYG
jgi:PhnB protein